MSDDNTNLIRRVSHDGQNFVTIRTESRTAFMTGDQIFIGLYSNTSVPLTTTLLSYSTY
ncbi:MAG: hypothetical protein K2X47_14695 [Bdellovibrionales bacterium]|nr:hypothetical protein [Bdellovibrionales bacterium]